jgi:RimJ/RimL family protein N-acetyltransferase
MALLMRDATLQDSDLMLNWRNSLDVRLFSHNKELISEKEHLSWFLNRLTQIQTQPFWLFEEDSKLIGMVRFDLRPEGNLFEINIVINTLFRGQGYGRNILESSIQRCINLYPEYDFRAEAHKKNMASKALFLDSGFREIDQIGSFLILERRANSN